MEFFKRGIALLFVVILCLEVPMNIVVAGEAATESTCEHRLGDRPSVDVLQARTTHKVYRNLYIGGEQAYAICNVEIHVVNAVQQCMICYANFYTHVRTYEVHSMEGDPDHK